MSTNATIQYAASELTAPLANTPALPPPNAIITSDSFSIVGSGRLITGEMTDAALGGEPMSWTTNSAPPYKENGVLSFPTLTGGSFLAIGEHTDIEFSLRIVELPSLMTSMAAVNLRALNNAPAPTNTAYRIGCMSDGRVRIEKRDPAGTPGLMTSTSQTIKPGDVLKGRIIGNMLTAYVNNVEVLRYTDVSNTVIASGTHVGISASELAGSWKCDDFVVRVIDTPDLL